MRRILAATLIGVLTGSLFTTVEPIITTPPPAQAAPVTVGGCEVDVVDESIGQLDKNHIGLAGGDGDPSGDGDPEYIRVSKDGNDCVLEFLKDSTEMTWTLPDTTAMELLIAGGGGGGSLGGGGAGGFFQQSEFLNPREKLGLTAKIYVGAGGAGRSTPLNNVSTATPGDDSWLFGSQSTFFGSPSSRASTSIGIADLNSAEFVMKGGGGGGDERYSGGYDGDGGSGGGGAEGYYNGDYDGGSYNGLLVGQRVNSNFGTNGGTAEFGRGTVETTTEEHGVGGGGGGAGGSGFTGLLADSLSDTRGGNGGVGKSSTITGSTRYFSGGGGGAAVNPTSGDRFGGSGGTGGGGAGGTGNGLLSTPHIAGGSAGASNTGGGGGGGNAGGSGIVIVRFAPPPMEPAPVLGSVTRTADGFTAEITNFSAVNAVADSFSQSVTNGSVSRSGSTVTVTGLTTGQSSILTVSSSRAGFSPASASITAAAKASQASLSITGSDSLRFGGSITVAASGGSGSGGVTFGVSSGDCVLDTDTLVLSSDGSGMTSCVVTATRAADANFIASTQATETFTIGKADRFVSFTSSVPADPRVNDTYTPTATATGGLPVTFSATGTCSIDGSEVVTFSSVGTCTITAASSGTDTNYSAATNVTQAIVVGLANQTITFGALADKDFDDRPFQLSASSSRGLEVSFTTSSAACTVTSSGVVSIDATGLCAVTASQAGVSGQIAAASNVAQTFRVQAVVPGAPRLTSVGFGDGSLTVGFIAPDYDGGGTISAYRAVATDSSNNQIVNNACGTSSPCTITGLTNGTTYTVTIAAVNEAGVGPVSNVSPATAPADRAQAVSGLSTVPGDGVLDVTWDQPSNTTELGGGNFTRYDVSIRPSGGSYGTAVTPDGTNNLATLATNSYQFTGLTNGTGYDVKVEAITDANSSQLVGRTAETSGVPAVAPSVVRDAEAVLVGNTGAFVSWATPASDGGLSITSYAVTPSSLSCEFDNALDQFCDITGLARGVTVSISIAAVNGIGAGQTVTVTVSTPALPSSGGGGDDTATPTPTASPTTGNVPRGFGNRPGNGDTRPGAGTPPPPPGGSPGNPIPPERPGASIGGVPVPTTTTGSPGGRGVSVSAGGVDVGVDVPDPGDGRGGVIDRDGTPEPVVTPGQGTTVSGGGAAPGSVVDVWLPGRGNTGPTNVAQIPVGEDGTFSADVDVFSDLEEPLPIGRNVVQIVTTNEDGQQILVDMPFTLAQGEPLPEVFRDTQQTPNAPIEGIVNTNKGDPTLTRVTSVPDQGLVNVESDTWVFTIQVNTQDAAVEGEDTNTVIRMAQNSDVTVTGSGFMPDTRVDVWAFSTPTLLGNAIVDDNGTVSVTVALTPQALTIGDHTLQLQAVGEDGFIRSSNLPVTIQDTPLAAPTSDSAATLLWWVVGVTGVLVAVIITVTLIARQRRNA